MTKKIFAITILILVFVVGVNTVNASSSNDKNLTVSGYFRLDDADLSNWVGLQAPSVVGTNYTLTFPANAGALNQVLTTDGSGGLSWTTASTGTVTSVSGGATGLTVTNPSTTPTLAGTLVVGNGGTGLASLTLNNLIYGNGTGNANLLAPGATTGMFLRNTAAGAPSWSTLVLPNAATTGDILSATSANTIGNLADVAVGRVLTSGGIGVAPAYSATPTLGVAGATLGTLSLAGNTSGTITIQPQAAAGTYNFNLPTGAGTSGQVLTSAGGVAAPMTWTTPTTGTVTSFSAGTLSPLFTTSVATATTTPALTFTLSNAGANTVFGNNTGSSAAPAFFNPTLASTLFNNQGTTTTLLHGNAAGNPSWGAVALGTDISGQLPLANGGTNANLTASNGGIFYSTGSAGAILAGTATAGQILRSGASTTPSWSTATYPATAGTSGNVLTSDGTNWNSSALSVAISALTAATGTNTIANANYLQTWNWQLTGATNALRIGETAASTGTGYILSLGTLAASTAKPLQVSALGSTIIDTTANGNLTFGSTANNTPITLQSGTGAINIGQDANAHTITIGNQTGGSALTLDSGSGAINIGTGIAKTITIGNSTGATALNLTSGSGNIKLEVGGSGVTGNVQIGGTASATPDLLVLDTKNTSGDPTCTNGAVYYNSNTSKLRCCQNSVWLDCIHNPSVDSVNDTSVTSPTPGTYPTLGTNIEILTPTNPTLTPTSTASRILVTGAVQYSNPASGDDTNAEISIQIRRGSGNCTGTQVGTTLTDLASDPIQGHWIPFSFIDSPATTSAQAYTVCAALADGNGAGATNATTPEVMMTIQEISPSGG